MLQMKNVSKTYRTDTVETHALREFSLIVDEGEFVSVTGPSGSGKTTFLNIAGMLEELTNRRSLAGSGRVDASPRPDPAKLRRFVVSLSESGSWGPQHVGQRYVEVYDNLADTATTVHLMTAQTDVADAGVTLTRQAADLLAKIADASPGILQGEAFARVRGELKVGDTTVKAGLKLAKEAGAVRVETVKTGPRGSRQVNLCPGEGDDLDGVEEQFPDEFSGPEGGAECH